MKQIDTTTTDEEFAWLNPPAYASFGRDGLAITTSNETDFWQRTHYGFRRDDGHFYYMRSRDDFHFTTQCRFDGKVQYDQCGLMVRIDAENWLKCSIEYENEEVSRLGSVVTNFGYSDWATQDIGSDMYRMHYGVHRNGSDFLIEYSFDGKRYVQMRVAHLHQGNGDVMVGVYACSPKRAGFECAIEEMAVGKSTWGKQQ